MKGFQGERLRQAFHYFDKDGDGYIAPDEFQRIIIVSGSWPDRLALTRRRRSPGTSCLTRSSSVFLRFAL